MTSFPPFLGRKNRNAGKCYNNLAYFIIYIFIFLQIYIFAIYMNMVEKILKFDGCLFKRNMQKKIKQLTCQNYYLVVMFSEFILKGQILPQKFEDLPWKTKLMKRVSQIMARINMVTFGSLTKHFVMKLVEYFSIIYLMTKNIILQMIMEKVKTKTKIKKQQLPCDIRSSFEHL